jgi:uncharacterized protein involved in type VI secretion and phage assembly
MPQGLIETAAQVETPEEPRFDGITLAEVINNFDPCGTGRVQIRYPSRPGVLAWARVVSSGAGLGRGFYAMPQVGDEVVVGFNNGDDRQPIVIGSVWNQVDRPAVSPDDAATAIVIRTRVGNEIRIDDAKPPSIRLTSPDGQFIMISFGPAGIVLNAASNILLQASNITLNGDNISLVGKSSLTLRGATVNIGGQTNFTP